MVLPCLGPGRIAPGLWFIHDPEPHAFRWGRAFRNSFEGPTPLKSEETLFGVRDPTRRERSAARGMTGPERYSSEGLAGPLQAERAERRGPGPDRTGERAEIIFRG